MCFFAPRSRSYWYMFPVNFGWLSPTSYPGSLPAHAEAPGVGREPGYEVGLSPDQTRTQVSASLTGVTAWQKIYIKFMFLKRHFQQSGNTF